MAGMVTQARGDYISAEEEPGYYLECLLFPVPLPPTPFTLQNWLCCGQKDHFGYSALQFSFKHTEARLPHVSAVLALVHALFRKL